MRPRIAVLLALAAALPASAQPLDPALFAGLRYRMIGPFRGGRTVAASGVTSQANVFYMAPNNGGIWKSDDYGLTWKPIFDGQPTGSIGAIAIAPSDPKVIYAGSGEGLQRPDLSVGDGIYKSADGGKTWQHLGLRDGYQIPRILVDPRDSNRILVAVLGHPYGPNSERGIYRSVDGGASFERVLGKDENTGGMDLAFDPQTPDIVYGVLWSARQAPWEVGESFQGPGSGLFKSIDGGTTWKPLTEGLPTAADHLGRIGITVAPSDGRRLYAVVDADPAKAGVYRSDDAGEHWRRVSGESRVWSRGSDFAWVRADPRERDTIYVVNTSLYRSTDAGQTFHAIKGAPGGDDYHTIWINPDHPEIMLLGVDQGATVTVNGGATWSSWYNQPTAQFYHVITDNRFPYWVYGGQQESGSAGVASRGDNGAISFREFRTVGVEEYGYVAPDPLNPNIIYGGKATRFDWTTGDVQDIRPTAPGGGKYRYVRTMPLIFSTVDPHALYLGANVIFKTVDGGRNWSEISGDLTRSSWEMPKVVGVFAEQDPEHGKHRGVVYAIAPSHQDIQTIWAGTDDGLVHITRDGGKTWKNITPPDLTPWSKVSQIDASHFDAASAYVAVNRFRLDDLGPHAYRTHDGGAKWTEIVKGLPERAVVNAIREDPKRKGLLYAGTELGIYVSFDDGNHWQPLQLNLPVTSVRDLVVKDDDLVVATHGRSFWILDDVTPLRQIDPSSAGTDHLFAPAAAVRWRRNRGTDTPLPPEEPVGENPPEGAMIDFYLAPGTAGPVTLDVYDPAGKMVRHYASSDEAPPIVEKDINVPLYWLRPFQPLPATAGMHRFLWDLRYAPPRVLRHGYPIAAIYKDTPLEPRGAWVLPGNYRVKLTTGGHEYSETLRVVMDPRIHTGAAGLAAQLDLSGRIANSLAQDYAALAEVRGIRQQVSSARARAAGATAEMLEALERELAGFETGRQAERASFTALNGELGEQFNIVQGTDNAPTTQATKAFAETSAALEKQVARWNVMKTTRLAAVNQQLRDAHLPELVPAVSLPEESVEGGEEEEP